MNKRQKEVQQEFLDSEKKVLEELKKNYKDALNEINIRLSVLESRDDADLQYVIYQKEYQKALKSQIETILGQLQNNNFATVSEYLTKSYEDGFIGTMYDLQGQGVPLISMIDQTQVVAAIQHETKLSEDLYTMLGKDTKVLSKQIASEISRGISSASMYSEIERNIANYAGIPRNNAARIARTEAHRIQCKAALDMQYKAKAKGADVVKQWDSSLDGNTRENHRRLDGQIREIDEPFEVDGMKAMQPGGFGIASEDINCRCAILQRARWALGNNYTKWSPDAPILIDDNGTTQLIKVEAKDFKEFKGYYKEITDQMAMNFEGQKAKETIKVAEGSNLSFVQKADSVQSSMPNDNKLSTVEQAKVNSRRAAYFEKQNKAVTNSVPDFNKMQHSEIVSWAEKNIKTPFEGLNGVNSDFYDETVKALAKFESKMGGKTIEGLSVKFGGVPGKAYAKYDDSTKTLLLKKKGSLDNFVESQEKENLRYKTKWKTDKDYYATTSYEGTVLHELGHAVDIESGQRLSKALSNGELNTLSVKISAYAGNSQGVRVTPRSEAWAENFAAYLENGKNADKVPEEIKKMIDDYFNDIKIEKIGKSGTLEANIVKESIDSGIVSKEINVNKQNRHILGSDDYVEGRSYIIGNTEDAQKLVDELSGTGEPVYKPNGEWNNKEKVTSDKIIGVNIDPITNEETETAKATIHYSKSGSHIIPRKGE